MNDFAGWLKKEMKSNGMSQSKLSELSGLHQGTISNVLTGKRQAGADFILAVARALRIKPEDLYRQTGLLPQKPSPTQETLINDIIDIVRRLSDDDKKELIEYARFKYQRAGKMQG